MTSFLLSQTDYSDYEITDYSNIEKFSELALNLVEDGYIPIILNCFKIFTPVLIL